MGSTDVGLGATTGSLLLATIAAAGHGDVPLHGASSLGVSVAVVALILLVVARFAARQARRRR